MTIRISNSRSALEGWFQIGEHREMFGVGCPELSVQRLCRRRYDEVDGIDTRMRSKEAVCHPAGAVGIRFINGDPFVC